MACVQYYESMIESVRTSLSFTGKIGSEGQSDTARVLGKRSKVACARLKHQGRLCQASRQAAFPMSYYRIIVTNGLFEPTVVLIQFLYLFYVLCTPITVNTVYDETVYPILRRGLSDQEPPSSISLCANHFLPRSHPLQ